MAHESICYKNKILITAIVYFLLLLDSGFYFAEKGSIYFILQIILATILPFIGNRRFNLNLIYIFAAFIGLIALASLFSGDTVRNFLITAIEIYEAFCIASACIGKASKDILSGIEKLFIAMCVFSIAVFVIAEVSLHTLSKFPIFTASNGTKCYFLGLTFAYAPRPYYVARNPGIFWEPGAFQMYILLIMMYEMFCKNCANIKYLIIYTISIATTISTTGIICCIILWIIYGISTTKIKLKSGIKILIFILLAIVAFVKSIEYLPDYIKYSVITKIESIFNNSTENYSSVSTRVDSFKYGVVLFLKNPVFGIGRGMNELKSIMGNGIASCTPINWFAQYGTAVGLLTIIGLYNFTKVFSRSIHICFALMAVILLSVSTEAFNYSPTFYFIIFIGYSQLKKFNSISSK